MIIVLLARMFWFSATVYGIVVMSGVFCSSVFVIPELAAVRWCSRHVYCGAVSLLCIVLSVDTARRNQVRILPLLQE